MKKTISILLIICTLTFYLASCDNNNNSTSHTHSYVESIYTQPSCDKWGGKGDKKYTCSVCGDFYIDYDSIPALECEWVEATCTSAKKCTICGKTGGYALGHDYSNTTDGTCTRCGFGVKFILPTTPMTISNTSGYDETCKIESIKIERIQEYSYSTPYYKLTFIVQRTYHEKGNNYSDTANFGWKLYDEDGLVVTSGTGCTDGSIKVGEKSKETITFWVGADKKLQDGKTFRLELLNIS